MLFVVIACVFAWLRLNGNTSQKLIRIALIGIVISGITVVLSASIPIISVPLGTEQELRVMPPTTFPLTMQQYRDYDADLFYYRIVLGWPDGLPVFEGVPFDDQSEFILRAHLNTGILLGGYMIAGLATLLVIIYLLELRKQKIEVNDNGS
ncbi:hypothetical protein EU527_09320 [Candidatus Thorarchaeota archaeon]|nr:MAG: hypothetical protein EU527_09320 [Candidatus Thorarchaeota archaeon]